MKNRRNTLVFLLLLAIFSLACGLLGGSEATDEPANETQAAATEADEPADSAEENVQNKALQVGGGLKAPEVNVVESDDDKAADDNATTDATTEGETEEAPLEAKNIQAAFADFSSYRWQMNLDFDGTSPSGESETGSVIMLLEAIKADSAFHMQMTLQGDAAAEFGGEAVIDMYAIDDTAYIKEPGTDSWLSLPAAGFMDDFFAQGFMDPDELVTLPETARRNVLPEDVNGISTWHYTFTEADLIDADSSLESAVGDIWIARDGGYPVKMVMEATGLEASSGSSPITSGTINMVYELLEVNTDFSIDLPADAANAESLPDVAGMMGGSVDPATVPYPLMADAEIDFTMEGMVSYSSASGLADVVAFYQAELANDGWTEDAASSFTSDETALLSFEKEGRKISLIIAKEADDSTSVILSEE